MTSTISTKLGQNGHDRNVFEEWTDVRSLPDETLHSTPDDTPHDLTEEDVRQEMQAIVKQEISDLRAGKEENVFLMEALANNWTANQLRTVAKRRGKNWRFLSALTDQILRAEGLAMISLASAAAGADMNHYMLKKILNVMDRTDRLARAYEVQGKLDDKRKRLFAASDEFLFEISEQTRQTFLRRIAQLLDRQERERNR